MNTRIVHMHIPKAAGTSVNQAFERLYEPERIFTGVYQPEFESIDYRDFDFYRGHIGFEVAKKLDANIVCVLRNPIDRFISVYYYWRRLYAEQNQREAGVTLAATLTLEEFVEKIDEAELSEELFNRITWQTAYGHHWFERQNYLDKTPEDLLHQAQTNLSNCAVVGRVENIPKFVENVYKNLGLRINVERLHTTGTEESKKKIPASLKHKIADWVSLDLELYWSCDNTMNW